MDHRSLLLLGLLMNQSQHGYQIHDFIETNLPFVTDIKKATAYAHLDKLSKDKYIDVKVEYDGNRPPRKVYSINEKGVAYFKELLAFNLSTADTVFYKGDIGLLFLDHLPKQDVIRYLQQRRDKVKEEKHKVDQTPIHSKSTGVNIAILHQQTMLQAELSFLERTMNQLKNEVE